MRIIVKLLLLFFWVTWGMAADYYVAKTGSDSNPGTLAQPWLTIRAAAERLRAGDTVYIRAGIYRERLIPQYPGSPGKYITYSAYGSEKVTIDGTGITLADDLHGLVEIIGKSYIIITGLRVMNAGPYLDNAGIFIDGSHHIIIEKNYTYNTLSSGIGSWNNTDIVIDGNEVELACNNGNQECITAARTAGFEVKNNHVHHSGPGGIGGEGICLKDGSSNGKVYGNHVHHLYRLGIYTDAWDKYTHDIDVYRNLVHDLKDSDGYSLASEMGGVLANIRYYNNIAYHCGTTGLDISVNGDSVHHPMKNITIINNTFYQNGKGGWGGGLALDNPDIEKVVIRNNIAGDNLSFQVVMDHHVPKAQVAIDHNLIDGYREYEDEIRGKDYIEGDPQFEQAAAADFSLKETSPAIDAGSADGAPADDYAGNNRPQGSGYDIGAYEYKPTPTGEPIIALNRETVILAAVVGTTQLLSENLVITNNGTGVLEWSAMVNRDWLKVAPAGGSGSGIIEVTANPTGLEIGSYTGSVIITSPAALNTPQEVTVTLGILSPEQDQPPIGSFETPLPGAKVSGSTAVTGWALDDIYVDNVKIYRATEAGEGNGLVYIGTGTFVEGARPDVEVIYPTYPRNNRAGWGYMLLTHFLPHQGNGTFTLHAVAADSSGKETLLGTKTITADNLDAVKPFGAIDTPDQGGRAAGSKYLNVGWALTPQPNRIPGDGTTISVIVDGVDLGHPVYDLYREDIVQWLPGYANSAGAGGYFYLDTTVYANGLHTISWTVRDSAGNIDGIGSRYFTIQNINGTSEILNYKLQNTNYQQTTNHKLQITNKAASFGQATARRSATAAYKVFTPAAKQPSPATGHLFIQKGYNPNSEPEALSPDENGQYSVEIKELERVVIYLENIETEGDRASGEYKKQAEPQNGFTEVLKSSVGANLVFAPIVYSSFILNSRTACQHLTLKNTPSNHYEGYLVSGDRLKPLPIGSTLDGERGIFYWQPGPGFVGEYRLVFIGKDEEGRNTRKDIVVNIKPKY